VYASGVIIAQRIRILISCCNLLLLEDKKSKYSEIRGFHEEEALCMCMGGIRHSQFFSSSTGL